MVSAKRSLTSSIMASPSSLMNWKELTGSASLGATSTEASASEGAEELVTVSWARSCTSMLRTSAGSLCMSVGRGHSKPSMPWRGRVERLASEGAPSSTGTLTAPRTASARGASAPSKITTSTPSRSADLASAAEVTRLTTSEVPSSNEPCRARRAATDGSDWLSSTTPSAPAAPAMSARRPIRSAARPRRYSLSMHAVSYSSPPPSDPGDSFSTTAVVPAERQASSSGNCDSMSAVSKPSMIAGSSTSDLFSPAKEPMLLFALI
mmetsp:Transcript_39103/g.74924  ORF Transcript_39103/g.74924 Transcript_39103/m.74924 type:complete len:265 (-) Transcript_39103:313-1107(-)